ncbi:ABC transporter ATP-binding protein [Futiania mangrovi]|uniref:Phosphate ABC transporter ATP-binding protein n=1 Tax=Futiania mangrovi TaxID=2959716 RepID=A0A9J6PBX5_9PROT|nr:phosphate ABC transporter ATP-binding protein [Futiania mangrovii]MCP1337676.1 phosphate ABC transporter ATP-binding protein [Futiania mangrovii]
MHGPLGVLPLYVRGLSFEAGGARLLDGVSFDLQPGERLVVIGPNGAGKSLLLRLCHGLLTPASGSVSWGTAPGALALKRRAMVFQRPLMLRRSALANITHALGAQGMARPEREERAATSLARFGLTHLARRPARVLSGGEQQRLAIARAWAMRPEVLLLDEPTSALDPTATRAIEEMIMACHADGMTIVMTTHEMGQARRMADRILFLNKGRLVEEAPAERFFTAPATQDARRFLNGDLLS